MCWITVTTSSVCNEPTVTVLSMDVTGSDSVYRLPVCETHLNTLAQAHVEEQGYPDPTPCMQCDNAAWFFVANNFGILNLCERHVEELGDLMAGDLKKPPFVLTLSCECVTSSSEWDDIMEAVFALDGLKDTVDCDGGHYTITLTTVDSYGQTLQLYPL